MKIAALKIDLQCAMSVQKEIELLGQRAVVFALIATAHTSMDRGKIKIQNKKC